MKDRKQPIIMTEAFARNLRTYIRDVYVHEERYDDRWHRMPSLYGWNVEGDPPSLDSAKP